MSGNKRNIFEKQIWISKIEQRIIKVQGLKLQLNTAENQISALQEENHLLRAEVQALRSLLNKKQYYSEHIHYFLIILCCCIKFDM